MAFKDLKELKVRVTPHHGCPT